MKQSIDKIYSNLYIIGALVGLSAFLGEQIVSRIMPLNIYLSLFYVSGFLNKYVTQLIVLLPLAFVLRSVFRKLKLKRAGYSALAAVWVTDMFVSLFTYSVRGWAAGWPTRMMIYLAVGTLITPLVVWLYGRIKNDAYAGYVAIVLLIILLVGVEFIANYINGQLLFRY